MEILELGIHYQGREVKEGPTSSRFIWGPKDKGKSSVGRYFHLFLLPFCVFGIFLDSFRIYHPFLLVLILD